MNENRLLKELHRVIREMSETVLERIFLKIKSTISFLGYQRNQKLR